MLAVYVLYILYLALRAFGELRAMNFLDARLKFHAASLTVVLALTMSIMISRYECQRVSFVMIYLSLFGLNYSLSI